MSQWILANPSFFSDFKKLQRINASYVMFKINLIIYNYVDVVFSLSKI